MIAKGKVVSLCYRLTNDKGTEIEKTDRSEPFSYLHGAKNIILGLERGLEGLKTGDKKTITVNPKEGYGEVDNSLRTIFDRTQFPTGTAIEPGDQFRVTEDGDEGTIYEVKKIEGDKIFVDGNHPLAGETLSFEVEVVEVRDATKEERSHGHVHGSDGHHHDH